MSNIDTGYEFALYYERVSTQHTEQDESMENQRALCVSFLKRHPEIHLAEPMDTYSERVSGKTDERPKYKMMLKRLERGDIRYVLVKDFKRLNRSMELAAQISNHAKEYNYRFILLSTGQVFDPNSEQNRMMYGFESLLNQEVVYRQSEYGRLAHRQKCEAKRLNRNNVTFGYSWDQKKEDIVIDEEKAEVVRKLFDLYVFKNYGVMELRKYLASIGYTYSANTVTKWLQETAYVGVFHLNKKGSELGVGAGKKTRRYINPKEEWVSVERPDLVIVDRDIFDLAQRIREIRNNHFNPAKRTVTDKQTGQVVRSYEYRQNRFRGTHLFSSKVFCEECGYPFVHGYADRAKEIGIYRDAYKSRAHDLTKDCPNVEYKRIYEEDLIDISISMINGIIENHQDCFSLLMNILEKVIREDTTHHDLIKEKKREIERLNKSAGSILDKFPYASGALLTDLNSQYNEIKEKIEKIKNEMVEMEGRVQSEDNIQQQLETIRYSIDKWKVIDRSNFDRQTVDAFIQKMIVHKDGVLEIILKTSETIELPLNIKERGRGAKSSSPNFCENIQTYHFNEEDCLSQMKDMIRKLWEGQGKIKERFFIFGFHYIEKLGNRKTRKKKEFVVDVEFELWVGKKNI